MLSNARVEAAERYTVTFIYACPFQLPLSQYSGPSGQRLVFKMLVVASYAVYACVYGLTMTAGHHHVFTSTLSIHRK